MGRMWDKARHHPFLAAGLVSAILIGGCFGVFQLVGELRAMSHFRAGQAALESGDFAAARRELDHCLKAWPDSAETRFLAARAARRNGDLADALRLLDAAQKRDWVPEAIELERALIYVQLGDLVGVEKFLSACIAEGHPDSALILEVIAPAYLRNFQLGEARHYATSWTEARPDSGPAWSCLAAASERQRDRKGAIAAYRHAVEVAPNSFRDRLRLVRLLLEALESTEALEHLERLRTDHPDDLDVRRELACCLSLRGESAKARSLLDEVLAVRPGDAEALGARGQIDLREGRPVEAERWLRRAAEKAPFERTIVYPFIQCLRRNGKVDEAQRWDEQMAKSKAALGRLEKVAKAAAAAPRDPEPRREAGVIFLQNGQDEEGLRWLTSALRQDPRHPATHRALAEYYERKGQSQQAAIHRIQADKVTP